MEANAPIVIIHGLFGNQSAPRILQAFGDVDIHAPDLIGYGRNRDLKPDGWSLLEQAEHMASFVRGLNSGPVHLVGHSVGGAVGALVAFRMPDLVASYTSVEGNFTLEDAFWSGEISQKPQSEVDRIYASYEADPDAWMSGAVNDMTPFASEVAHDWLANQSARTVKHQATAVVQATKDRKYLVNMRALMKSHTPVCLIAGALSAEGWNTPRWANALCDKRINIRGVGHLMMVESPQTYADAVLDCVVHPRGRSAP
jgi:pimeloyl-ACP methyl ester carboxylesterase